jgi:hypothetical protein
MDTFRVQSSQPVQLVRQLRKLLEQLLAYVPIKREGAR